MKKTIISIVLALCLSAFCLVSCDPMNNDTNDRTPNNTQVTPNTPTPNNPNTPDNTLLPTPDITPDNSPIITPDLTPDVTPDPIFNNR